MATYRKRGDKWRAEVCANGIRRSKTFIAKASAKAWATKLEHEIEEGSAGKIPNKTFADLLTRYRDEVTVTKRGRKRETTAIDRLIREDTELAGVNLRELSAKHIAKWRDMRLKDISGSSVDREMNILSHACNVARREWEWLMVSPTADVSRPQRNEARARRPTQDETDRLMLAMDYDQDSPPVTKAARVAAAYLFALETGIREGEIAAIATVNVHERYVHLPATITKSGRPRDVPLSIEAKRILKQVMAVTDELGSDTVFGVKAASIDALYRKYRAQAGVEGLQFRDTRHEALTKLSKKYDVMELAKISGHRDLKILLNVYYNPTVDDLADKID